MESRGIAAATLNNFGAGSKPAGPHRVWLVLIDQLPEIPVVPIVTPVVPIVIPVDRARAVKVRDGEELADVTAG